MKIALKIILLFASALLGGFESRARCHGKGWADLPAFGNEEEDHRLIVHIDPTSLTG